MRNRDAEVTRNAALFAFGQCESLQEQETPGLLYPELLARVHRRIADSLGMQSDPQLDEAFGASVPDWPAFPDTRGRVAGPQAGTSGWSSCPTCTTGRHRGVEPQARGRVRRDLHG